MRTAEFLSDIAQLFERHQIPAPERDPPEGVTKIEVLLLKAMEVILSTVQDLQSAINSQGSKLSQLEADTNALITKAGTASAPPVVASGLSIDQATLDDLTSKITANNARIDTLAGNVVSGGQTPTSGTPTPAAPSTPAPDSGAAPAVPSSDSTTASATPAPDAAATPASSAPATPPASGIQSGAIPPGQTPLSVASGAIGSAQPTPPEPTTPPTGQ